MKRISHAITFLFFISFLFISISAFSQKNSGYTIMRVFDCNRGVGMGAGYLHAGIVIAYENGTTEQIELQPYSEKAEVENLKTIAQTLNDLKAKGYKLITQSTTGEQGSLITDYTFLKEGN